MPYKNPIKRYISRKTYRLRRQPRLLSDGTPMEFRLTEDDVQRLLDEAGITMDDVGRSNHQYALARYHDEGHYVRGNCRFITTFENREEYWSQSRSEPYQFKLNL